MGKIDDAKAAVSAIEREIEDMRRELYERKQELWTLQKSENVDDIGRAQALKVLTERLEAALPKVRPLAGDPLPEVQHRLMKAQEALERVRRSLTPVFGVSQAHCGGDSIHRI